MEAESHADHAAAKGADHELSECRELLRTELGRLAIVWASTFPKLHGDTVQPQPTSQRARVGSK